MRVTYSHPALQSTVTVEAVETKLGWLCRSTFTGSSPLGPVFERRVHHDPYDAIVDVEEHCAELVQNGWVYQSAA